MILVWIVLIIEITKRRELLNEKQILIKYLRKIYSRNLLQTRKLKSMSKGGDPTNIHMTGKELTEQVFSNSSVEINQEDSTKFITIARRMVDNVYDFRSVNG